MRDSFGKLCLAESTESKFVVFCSLNMSTSLFDGSTQQRLFYLQIFIFSVDSDFVLAIFSVPCYFGVSTFVDFYKFADYIAKQLNLQEIFCTNYIQLELSNSINKTRTDVTFYNYDKKVTSKTYPFDVA